MVNRVELIGNLTADPELHYTPSGTPYCHVRVATNRRTKSGEETDFHFVIAWRDLAERTAEFLRTGDRVYVEGRIENNSYANKDGHRVERYRVVASRVLALERRKDRSRRISVPGNASPVADVLAQAVDAAERREPAEDSA